MHNTRRYWTIQNWKFSNYIFYAFWHFFVCLSFRVLIFPSCPITLYMYTKRFTWIAQKRKQSLQAIYIIERIRHFHCIGGVFGGKSQFYCVLLSVYVWCIFFPSLYFILFLESSRRWIIYCWRDWYEDGDKGMRS